MSDNILGIAAYSDREALANFIEAMKVAESAAKQMAFYTQSPEWIIVESKLGDIREVCIKLAQAQLANRRLLT